MDLKRIVFFFFTLIVLVFGCTSEEKSFKNLNIKTVKQFQFSDSTYIIQIDNLKEHPIKFNLNINDIFPLDDNKLRLEIEKMSFEKKISSEKSAWLFVSNHTFHSKPLTIDSWQHHPLLFLNSIGGGLCDDKASVLAKLWMTLGDSSRIIGLNGHVVPEVFVNQKWQMFDPDNSVYYCNEGEQPQSVNELELSKDSILISNCNSTFVNPIFKFQNPISRYITGLYQSDDNEDVTHWHLNYSSDVTNDFVLPPYSNLKIIYNKVTGITNLLITLTSKSKGQLKVPLVPYEVSGKAQFQVNNKDVYINNETILLPQKQFHSEIEVVNVDKQTEINYLINPKLNVFKDNNSLVLNSSDSLSIKIKSQSKQNPNAIFGEEYLFFDTKSIEYKDYLTVISNYKNDTIDENFFYNEFKRFLDYDTSLSKEEKMVYINKFPNDYKKIISLMNDRQQSIIKEKYPKSVLYIFLASRYQKLDYISKILNQQK